MRNSLPILNAVIFFLLGLLHFYWALGGRWGTAYAVPSKAGGGKLFTPGTLSCIMVGSILLLFSVVFLLRAGLIVAPFFQPVQRYTPFALTMISAIFAFRAIGEFKYVGFTKTVKDTAFAKMDTRYYSPLCLYLALSSFIIIFL